MTFRRRSCEAPQGRGNAGLTTSRFAAIGERSHWRVDRSWLFGPLILDVFSIESP